VVDVVDGVVDEVFDEGIFASVRIVVVIGSATVVEIFSELVVVMNIVVVTAVIAGRTTRVSDISAEG
jgi:hypothetical protein